MPQDAGDLLPAERKVVEELGHLPLDFRAMAAVSNLFRASAAIRRHMEAKVLADDRLSWTSFVAMWVLWVWGEMESRDLASAVGISRPTSTGVVTTLEGRGYVRRSKTAEDGRLVRVTLTDTLPVRIWAKMTMMVESVISLITAILVIARAINVLPG
jgi:DNA-binding MarR family transcriptional regulator